MSEALICPDCKGTGVRRVEIPEAINWEPCKTCLPPVQSCDSGHIHILFSAHACPLCAAMIRIEFMDKELRSWRGTKSEPRLGNDRGEKGTPVL